MTRLSVVNAVSAGIALTAVWATIRLITAAGPACRNSNSSASLSRTNDAAAARLLMCG
ncbi:MAG TPA: hypothetical protein VFG35_17335 [Actinoplanes sp.]|nr:hypothetical protein [Actinoplanes sp.]